MKQRGMSIRCSRVDPLRQPAASTKIGWSPLGLATSGHRLRIAAIPDAIVGFDSVVFMSLLLLVGKLPAIGRVIVIAPRGRQAGFLGAEEVSRVNNLPRVKAEKQNLLTYVL